MLNESTPRQQQSLELSTALQRARSYVMRFGWNSAAYQILNPGIELWFSKYCEAVIGFVRYGRYCIVAGAPVCAVDRVEQVVEEFEEYCVTRGLHAWYFCAGTRLAQSLGADACSRAVVLGAEPVWKPSRFLEQLMNKGSLRAQCARASNKGVYVEEWSASEATSHPALQECLDRWLDTRGLAPLHFLVESRTLDRLLDRRIFVARTQHDIVAFSVLSPIVDRNGWLVEQNVRSPKAPNGSVELTLRFAAEQLCLSGADMMSMGLSPLSIHTSSSDNALWLRLLFRSIRRYAQPFYNFRGLDAFKSKFEAERWDPVYAMSLHERCSPSVLWAIAGAFTGASPLWSVLRAARRIAKTARH